MNKIDAAFLLAHAATFDNRHASEAANEAWAAALYDVPYDDDARAAVARYYGTPPARDGERMWLQPHHVRSGRIAIRKDRLGATLPGYLPPRELETGAEFVARRQQQIAAVADGQVPARPIPLAGGPAPAVESRLEEGGYIPRHVREVLAQEQPERAERERLMRAGFPDPRLVDCPVESCRAGVRMPCTRPGRGGTRHRLSAPHPSRVDRAAAVKAGVA
ncbi:hypothetical protein ACFXGT_08250 [Streptomyces sp. NPDC059352]|uniref:zinc finger domain-containing protein n=1 Tax=Streptomyces sp. NPDC059352 TaxID=3346810 RepID=UPI0036AA1386